MSKKTTVASTRSIGLESQKSIEILFHFRCVSETIPDPEGRQDFFLQRGKEKRRHEGQVAGAGEMPQYAQIFDGKVMTNQWMELGLIWHHVFKQDG